MIITVDIDGVPLCDLGGLGFEVTRMQGSEAYLQLPDNWIIERDSEHTTKIIDGNGNWRATHVETMRNGERLHLLTRYSVQENWNGDTCNIVVLDRGREAAIIHTETIDLYDGNWVSFTRAKNEAIAKYFAAARHWRNPLAYWNEQ